LKNLKALDDYIVTDEERIDFTSPNASRFRALSHFMKIMIPKFQENQQADQHLFNLEVDLYRIRRLHERNSPAIRIQSFLRGYNVRSQSFFSAAERVKAVTKIQKVYRGWIYRLKIKRELQAMLREEGMEELLLT
jgi:IQ calmodulin-binding motif